MNEALISNYKDYLDNGKTERECVSKSISLAREKGYVELSEKVTIQSA